MSLALMVRFGDTMFRPVDKSYAAGVAAGRVPY